MDNTGNMAAMRKTLEEMATELEDLASREGIRAPAYSSVFSIYAEKCRKAIAEPPRNCDRDLSDRSAIFKEFRGWIRASSLGCASEPSASDAFAWLLAPATEQKGGAK